MAKKTSALGRGFSTGAKMEKAFAGSHTDYSGPGSASGKTKPEMSFNGSSKNYSGPGSQSSANKSTGSVDRRGGNGMPGKVNRPDSFTRQRGNRGDLHQ